jgi:hypothetical protein
MLKDSQKVIANGRTVVADFQRMNPETENGIVEISVYRNGSLQLDQVFSIPYKDLRQIYVDFKNENSNPHLVEGTLNDGLKIKRGKRKTIMLKPKEIYSILIKGNKVIRDLTNNKD